MQSGARTLTRKLVMKPIESTPDRVTFDTARGQATAKRQTTFGGSKWSITYPWGTDLFYGSRSELHTRMTRTIAQKENHAKDSAQR